MIKLIKKDNYPICLISGNTYYFAMEKGDILGVNTKNKNIKDTHKSWVKKIDDGVQDGLYSEEELSNSFKVDILCGMSILKQIK